MGVPGAVVRAARPALDELFAHLRSGEQRPATILMTDVSGFSTFGERAEPEWLFHLINEVFGELVECLVAHGAHIDNYVGDEIVALFGVPVALEKSVERAVRAALATRERLRVLNQQGRFGATPLGIHTGINVGPVMVGPVGHRAYADYTVIGDAVNVAKRLEEEAPEGEIYVSRAVRDAVQAAFELEPVGLLSLGGRRQQVAVFRLLGTRPGEARALAERVPEGLLVGREAELGEISRCARRAASGEQTCAYVVGPAGIGKSRLVAEWCRSEQAQAFRTVATACHAFGEHFPLLPLVDIVAQLAGLRLEGWPPRVSGDVERAVSGLPVEAPARSQLVPLLRYLESSPQEAEASWREGLCDGLIALLQGLASRQPLGLIVEDVQWMDEASRAVLTDFLSERRRWPLLVLLSGREPDEEWVVEALQATPVRVPPLSRSAMERLVEAWAVPAVLPPQVRQAICDRAQGHPYFAHELVRGLGGPAADLAAEVSPPDTLHELFLSQLDRLALPLRRLVQAASVVGEPMSYPLLEAAMGGDAPLTTSALAEATQQGLLHAGPAPGQFVFGRRLLFEAAYATIPPTQRRDLHAAVAGHLGDRLEALGEAATHAAAHHAYLGYQDERALDLLLRSARLYRAQYANRQAILTANRAIELIGSLSQPATFLDQRLEALLLLAQSYEVVGDLERAEGALVEAESLADGCSDEELVGRIAMAAATLRLMQGNAAEAQQRFRRAREAWERLGNEPRAAHALLGMGLCARQVGEPVRALELFTQAAQRGASALWVKAAALNNAGMVLLEKGRYGEAEAYLREGLRANELDGDRRGVAHSKASLGELCYRLAEFAEARRWLEEAVTEAGEIEDAECRLIASLLLSRVYSLEERVEAAGEALDGLDTPGTDERPEVSALRRLAHLEATLAAETLGPRKAEEPHEMAPQPSLEAELPSWQAHYGGACANAHVEILCVGVEAGLRRGERQEAARWGKLLAEHLPRATDGNLRRYGEWLLALVAAPGQEVAALPAADTAERTVFDVRAERLRESLTT